MQHLQRLFLGLTALVLVAGPAAASDKTDVMVPVHQFVDGLNKGDVKTAIAACAEQASIIDEFPPHEWHGAGACGKWVEDFDADAKKSSITDGVVTLGTARHVFVNGDRAYVVVPADYTYKMKGKEVKQTASTFTAALQKGSGGWRITAWAWSQH
jgi:ketosteroid isomerase-like protein